MRKVTLEVDESVAAALCLFLRYVLKKGSEDMAESEVGPHMKTVVMADPDLGDKISDLQQQLNYETMRFAADRLHIFTNLGEGDG